ncbi:hypothetical protein J4439_02655 [Candidatus Woesearchaeota archaeon]|nr:hypothetical protein [Candidatus Woesearchaeota archaeon]
MRTADGSLTIRGPEGELLHPLRGAVAEAVRRYVVPCRIAELARQHGRVMVLDIGFGLGYCATAAIDAADAVRVVSLERSRIPLRSVPRVSPQLAHYHLATRVARECLTARSSTVREGSRELTLVLGDARRSVPRLREQFDAVFLDAPAPRLCPELWSVEFFQALRGVMHEDALVVTYQGAEIVRAGLVEAGFSIAESVETEPGLHGTLASLQRLPAELTEKYRVKHVIHDPGLRAPRRKLLDQVW